MSRSKTSLLKLPNNDILKGSETSACKFPQDPELLIFHMVLVYL